MSHSATAYHAIPFRNDMSLGLRFKVYVSRLLTDKPMRDFFEFHVLWVIGSEIIVFNL